jgi:hypothetical protein
VDGGLDVLGDGGGALVVAGLVPVEPPHVVRLQSAGVEPLVGQPPPPPRRLHSASASSSSSPYAYTAVHLHYHHRHKPERAGR